MCSVYSVIAVAAGLLILPTTANAADLDVQVVGADGAPVRGAVVTVRLVGQPTPRPRPGPPVMIDQQDIQFHPFITTVPIGSSVMFMNHDAVRHHVYSFSSAKKFELKLTGKQENRAVVFDKAGIVPLGCNIHDRMIAYVNVVDTPWAKTADAAGHALLRGLPTGNVTITVWHPYLRAPGNAASRNVPLSETAVRRDRFAVPMRPGPRDAGGDS